MESIFKFVGLASLLLLIDSMLFKRFEKTFATWQLYSFITGLKTHSDIVL